MDSFLSNSMNFVGRVTKAASNRDPHFVNMVAASLTVLAAALPGGMAIARPSAEIASISSAGSPNMGANAHRPSNVARIGAPQQTFEVT